MTTPVTAKHPTPQVLESLPAAYTPLEAFYCNGFDIGMGSSDMFLVASHNGKRIFILNLSYTTAKTLAEGLMKTIVELEQKSGNKIMSSLAVAEYLHQGKDDSGAPKS